MDSGREPRCGKCSASVFVERAIHPAGGTAWNALVCTGCDTVLSAVPNPDLLGFKAFGDQVRKSVRRAPKMEAPKS